MHSSRFTYKTLSPKMPMASGAGVCVLAISPLPASASEKSWFAAAGAALPYAARTNTTVHGFAGSAWVWPDSAWIAAITSAVISRRRWRRLPA